MRKLILILLLLSGFNSFAQEFDTTSALKGEGIHALLRRFDMDSSFYLKEFIRINQDVISENGWLQEGQVYHLPAKLISKTEIEKAIAEEEFVVEPLLGETNKKITILDKKLEGAVFYIISGHGGPDPGAMGTRSGNKMCEDEYAYDVSLRLYRNLISHGAKVYMVIRDTNDGIRDEDFLDCDHDEICMDRGSIPVNQNNRLKQRVKTINDISKHIPNSVYERAIVIHCDSRSVGKRLDVFFYHYDKSSKGKSLAYSMLNTFDAKYAEHQPSRGYQGTVSTRSLYLINYARPPLVYIELGNIQNDLDQIRFIKENNRQALANWLTESILNDHEKYVL